MIDASPLLVYGFVALALLLTVGIAVVFRDARLGIRITIWLAVTVVLAERGLAGFDRTPPPILFVIAVGNGLAMYFALKNRANVPLAALVALQSFRLPLELLMHRAYNEGVMPVQMSYSGLNFDILTGLLAIPVAFFARKRGLVAAWNVLGTGLLLTIVTIAFLSAPLPIRMFHNEPANVWISHPPFVWLPAFFVPTALAGHILIYKRLRRRQIDGAVPQEPSFTSS
jgi:hypothetical protein